MPIMRTSMLDITPPATGAGWYTIDLESETQVNAAGVMLAVVNTAVTSSTFGIRQHGTFQNLRGRGMPQYLQPFYVGVDQLNYGENIEISIDNTDIRVYLLGEFSNTEVTFFETWSDIYAVGTSGAWETINLSSESVVDGSPGVILLTSGPAGSTVAVRRTGSTDNVCGAAYLNTAVVGLDGSKTFEAFRTIASGRIYLVGYCLSGQASFFERVAIALTGIGAYEGCSVSATVSGDGTIVAPIVQFFNNTISGNDSNVVSLLHMNGASASTAFTDTAASGTHAWTAYGTAQIDDATYKFRTGSGIFDGVGAYISTPYSTDFDFGAGDFTWDFWINLTSLDPLMVPGSYVVPIGIDNVGSTDYNMFYWTGAPLDRWLFACVVGGVIKCSYNIVNPFFAGVWGHVAIVRNGTDLLMFINGVLQVPAVGTAIGTNSITPVTNNPFYVGRNGDNNNSYLYGRMDEVRISKGIARWTATFTPPTAPYGVNYLVAAREELGSDDLYYKVPMGEVIYYPVTQGNNHVIELKVEDISLQVYISGYFGPNNSILTQIISDTCIFSDPTPPLDYGLYLDDIFILTDLAPSKGTTIVLSDGVILSDPITKAFTKVVADGIKFSESLAFNIVIWTKKAAATVCGIWTKISRAIGRVS